MNDIERSEGESPVCRHFQRAAELIGKRWNPQVVRALQTGSARFSDLKHAVPNISDAVLSERLKELEAEGIVHARRDPLDPGADRVSPHRARQATSRP